jgi:alpha-ketoglutaric semialdehyde dehydrogenase
MKNMEKKVLSGKNYIGNSLEATGDTIFHTFNPRINNWNKTDFIEATELEVEKTIQLAHTAFQKMHKIGGPQRASFLLAIVEGMEARKKAILVHYCSETGLSEERCLTELNRTLFQLRSFAELILTESWRNPSIDLANPEAKPPSPDIRKTRIPLGPIVLFGASNFPLAYSTAGGDTAAALASGNAVIVKSHPMHAGTGEVVASAIIEAAIKTGMPEGVFSNLNAKGFEVGKQLVTHPLIKSVGFTGSIRGGTSLIKLANQRKEPIPVFAEMGSVNPVVLLPKMLEEEMDKWSTHISDSIMAGTGQFCTSPGLIFMLKNDTSTTFIQQLETKLMDYESSCMLHPNIYDQFERLKNERSINCALTEKEGALPPNFARQTIAHVSGAKYLQDHSLQEEVFGPFTLVVKFNTVNELLQGISQLNGQLTGTIIGTTEELQENSSVFLNLQNKVGRLVLNGVPTGVTVCPSMHHGGPFPSSSDSQFTAVGIDSILRFTRPVCFQNVPDDLLPLELKNINRCKIQRRVNGLFSGDSFG